MNIFIGCIEIAGQINDFALGLKEIGYKTTTFIRSKPHTFQKNSYDYVLNASFSRDKFTKRISRLYGLIKYPLYIAKFIYENDLFIFQYGESFIHGFDLPIIKMLNKKIIIIFNGSDARWWPSIYQQYSVKGYLAFMPSDNDLTLQSFKRTLRNTRYAEKYADLIIGQQNTMVWSLRPYFFFRLPINLRKYNFSIPQNNRLLIVHAPSRRLGKGTDIIDKTLARLRSEGFDFEYKKI